MKIRTLVIGAMMLCGVTGVSASWMGETWLWVSITSVEQSTNGGTMLVAGLAVKHWGMGAGHGTTYGKEFPGRSLRVNLVCSSETVARGLRVGQSGWVKHRASSWMFRGEDGRARSGSHSRWEWLGDTAWIPVAPIHNNPPESLVTRSDAVSLLWVARGEQYHTFKLRFATMGKYSPKPVLVQNQGRLEVVIGFEEHAYSGNGATEDEIPVLVENAAFGTGERVLYWNGKKLVPEEL